MKLSLLSAIGWRVPLYASRCIRLVAVGLLWGLLASSDVFAGEDVPEPPTVRKGQKASRSSASNDPLGFYIQAGKSAVRIGEPVSLTITGRHLAIPSSLMFSFEEANSYRLKLVVPDGFVITGGSYYDYVGGRLEPGVVVTYTVEGYFESAPGQSQFRLLRGAGTATPSSLFVLKRQLTMHVLPAKEALSRQALDPCAGITLTASANPNSVASGGNSTLLASCQGCGNTGTPTVLYSTGFENDTKGVTFEVDEDQMNIFTNAQNMFGFLCPVGDRQGNANGKVYVYAGNSTGRLWQKSFNVTSGTTYSFSLWVRPIYDGTLSTNRPRAVELVVNGQVVQATTVDVTNNANCNKGWVQLSGSWQANVSGSVPFVFRTTQADGWQSGFAIDDLTIGSVVNTNTIVYSTGFENDVVGSTFAVDEDQLNIFTNAQNMFSFFCPVGDRQGNASGKVYVYAGNSSGRLWQKSFAVTSGTTYSFSLWVRPTHSGTPPAGRARAVELVVNGQVIQAATVDVMNNANCSKGWVQLSGSWQANVSGSVPFVFRTTQADGWQSGFAIDDLTISSSGGNGATYLWEALNGGAITNPNQATTPVSLPATAGTYNFRVTLTNGSCITSQIVPITVTASPCGFGVSASANTTTPSCNAAITLNATPSGSNTSGLTYTWSGPGVNQPSGQSVNATVPGSNGSYAYQVTASRQGCASQTATVNVTVSNCPTGGSGRVGTRRENFDVTKSTPQAGVVYLTDASSLRGQGVYNTHYFVNDVYVGAELANYPVPVNGKYVLDKIISRSAIPTGTGYKRVDMFEAQQAADFVQSFHQQVIDTYDPNTAIPGDQAIDNGKGTLLTVQNQWLIRTNGWNYQAISAAPVPAITPLTAGKLFGGVQIDGGSSLSAYKAKGWMMFQETPHRNNASEAIPNNERFWVENVYSGSGLPNPTYEQGRAAADNAGSKNFKFQSDQLGEATGFSSGSAGYIGYNKRLKEICQSCRVFANYGQVSIRYRAPGTDFKTVDGGARNPIEPNTYLNRYQSQTAARTKPLSNGNNAGLDDFYADRYAGESLSSAGIDQLIQYYPSAVNEVDVAYVKMHERDVMLKQDSTRRPILFFWPYREYPSEPGKASWVDGVNKYEWDHEVTNQPGRAIKTAHSTCAVVAPEILAFDAMVRGDGIAFWHDSPYQVEDPNLVQAPLVNYIPNTPGNQFAPVPENASARFTKPRTPLVSFDAAHQGRDKALRALQHLGTNTPRWQYLAYSLNGVTEPAPNDGSAILLRAKYYKPMVMLLRNPDTGKRVVWAVDPYCAPNTSQTITATLDNNTTISIPMKGNGVHVVLIN